MHSSASPAADAELCMMAADTMEALGIRRGDYVVKVNNRKILDGVLETIGLGGDNNAGRRLTVLRAIDKLDRLGISGVQQLLGPGRKDESGDFTKGAELDAAAIQTIIGVISPETEGAEKIAQVDLYLKDSPTGQQGRHELEEISKLIAGSGYGDRVVIEPTVVRGLEYYTGPVFETELLAKDDSGRPVRFGSAGGGGRYDGLVARFRGEPVPATGFSIGVSRLMAMLMHLGKVATTPERGPVVVTVFDKARLDHYQRLVKVLRDAGIRAELYLGSGRMGPQLKYADRRASPCVIIQGPDEAARGEVQIKDLVEGAKAAAAIASNQEWRSSRPAQFAVPEDHLVAAVRELLDRHAAD
jgi:histidyl-tRNA synthetase